MKALAIGLVPLAMLFLATQLPTLQSGLLTTPLTANEWLICAGLAALLPIAVEIGKWIRRRRVHEPTRIPAEHVVSPSRAWSVAPHEEVATVERVTGIEPA